MERQKRIGYQILKPGDLSSDQKNGMIKGIKNAESHVIDEEQNRMFRGSAIESRNGEQDYLQNRNSNIPLIKQQDASDS